MFLMLIGVISTTRKVKIQFDAVANAAALVREANGEYSAGTGIQRLVTLFQCYYADSI